MQAGINQFLGYKTTHIIFFNVDEDNITDEAKIAESINEYFTSIGSNLAARVPITNIKPESYVDRVESSFSFNSIDVNEMYKALNNLKTPKSIGPDKVPIKDSSFSIAVYLTKKFNALTSSVFPQKWKPARASPIYKTGDKRECGNY